METNASMIDSAMEFPILETIESPKKASSHKQADVTVCMQQLSERLQIVEELLHYRHAQRDHLQKFDLETNLRSVIEDLLGPTTRRIEESREILAQHDKEMFRLDGNQNEIAFNVMELSGERTESFRYKVMESINEKFLLLKAESEKRENILLNTISQYQEKIDAGVTRCNDIVRLVKTVEENNDNLARRLKLEVKAETNNVKGEISHFYPKFDEIRNEISQSQQYKEFVNLRLSSFETSLNTEHHLLMEHSVRLTQLEGRSLIVEQKIDTLENDEVFDLSKGRLARIQKEISQVVGELQQCEGQLRADFRQDIKQATKSVDQEMGQVREGFKQLENQIGAANFQIQALRNEIRESYRKILDESQKSIKEEKKRKSSRNVLLTKHASKADVTKVSTAPINEAPKLESEKKLKKVKTLATPTKSALKQPTTQQPVLKTPTPTNPASRTPTPQQQVPTSPKKEASLMRGGSPVAEQKPPSTPQQPNVIVLDRQLSVSKDQVQQIDSKKVNSQITEIKIEDQQATSAVITQSPQVITFNTNKSEISLCKSQHQNLEEDELQSIPSITIEDQVTENQKECESKESDHQKIQEITDDSETEQVTVSDSEESEESSQFDEESFIERHQLVSRQEVLTEVNNLITQLKIEVLEPLRERIDSKLDDYSIELKSLVRKQFKLELKEHSAKVEDLFEEFQSYKEKQKNEVRRKADFDVAFNTLLLEIKMIKNELVTIRGVTHHEVLTLDEHLARNRRTFFNKNEAMKDCAKETLSEYNTEDTNSGHHQQKRAKFKPTIGKHMVDRMTLKVSSPKLKPDEVTLKEKKKFEEAPGTQRNSDKHSLIMFEENGFHSDRLTTNKEIRPITGGRLKSNKRILDPIEKKPQHEDESSSSTIEEEVQQKKPAPKRKKII